LVYADDVNVLGGSVHSTKKKMEALFDRNDTGLEVNADTTKYMVMARDQNAGRSHSIQIDSSSFARVEQFGYLGTALTNQNSIQEEIKGILKSGNACYHSVQNLWPKRDEVTGEWRKLHSEELNGLNCSSSIIRLIK
jgi:hypothetical protein